MDNKRCGRILRSALGIRPTIKRTELQNQPDTGNSFPSYKATGCTGCLTCADVCPTRAVTIKKAGQMRIDYGSCIACRACIDVCTTGALTTTSGISGSLSMDDLSYIFGSAPSTNKKEVAIEAAVATKNKNGRKQKQAVPKEAKQGSRRPVTASKGRPKKETIKKEIIKLFVRSMHVREVDCGSCNACELEIAAITNPFYDADRFGIHIVASPRHADVLFVTGPVTRQMELALRKTDAATPSPKLIVAVGTCACSGGLFGNTHAAGAGVEDFVDVDLYIPGCPPSPRTIIKSIMELRSAANK